MLKHVWGITCFPKGRKTSSEMHSCIVCRGRAHYEQCRTQSENMHNVAGRWNMFTHHSRWLNAGIE